MRDRILLAAAVILLSAYNVAADFEFVGYVQYMNGTVPDHVNVTVLEYNGSWEVVGVTYNDTPSGDSGFYMAVSGDNSSLYKLKAYAYTDATYTLANAMSPNLPDFPQDMYEQPPFPEVPSLYNQTIYLNPATTLNITSFRYVFSTNCQGMGGGYEVYCIPGTGREINGTNYNETNQSFYYMISDNSMGMPVEESWTSSSTQASIVVTVDRNYTLELMPSQSPPSNFPIYLSAADQGTLKSYYVNTSFDFQNITGYILENGTTPFLASSTQDVHVFTFHRMPGKGYRMMSPRGIIPKNLQTQLIGPDYYDNDTGTYFRSLDGGIYGTHGFFLVFANKSGSTYVGAQNFTVTYVGPPNENRNQMDINISVYPTSITKAQAQVKTKTFHEEDFAAMSSSTEASSAYNVVYLYGESQDGSGYTQLTTAFTEMEIGYNISGSLYRTYWMMDLQPEDNGALTWAFPDNIYYAKVKVFSNQYAPRNVRLDLSNPTQCINLTSFGMEKFGDDSPEDMNMSEMGLGIEFWRAGTQGGVDCDALYPSNETVCRLGSPFQGGFNPIQAMMSGIINFHMYLPSGVELRMMHTDLMASGPPDAMMDEESDDTHTGSRMEQVWQFGSKAPDIYEYVWIGIPLNSSRIFLNESINISIPYLYDDDMNKVFDLTEGDDNDTVAGLYDYEDFIPAYQDYFTESGLACSTSDWSSLCIVNVSNERLWMKIPHFSTVAPSVKGKATSTAPTPGGTRGGKARQAYHLNASHDNVGLVDKPFTLTVYKAGYPDFTLYGAEVWVYLDGSQVSYGETDKNGLYTFTPTRGGQYTFIVEQGRYYSYEGTFEITEPIVVTTSTVKTTTSTATTQTTSTTATSTTTITTTTSTTATTTSTSTTQAEPPIGMAVAERSTVSRLPAIVLGVLVLVALATAGIGAVMVSGRGRRRGGLTGI